MGGTRANESLCALRLCVSFCPRSANRPLTKKMTTDKRHLGTASLRSQNASQCPKREALGYHREALQPAAETRLPAKHFPQKIRKGKRPETHLLTTHQHPLHQALPSPLPLIASHLNFASLPHRRQSAPDHSCKKTYVASASTTRRLRINSLKKTRGQRASHSSSPRHPWHPQSIHGTR